MHIEQVALAPAKAARRGLQEAAATAATPAAPAGGATTGSPLPLPREIEASMRALEAAEARQEAAPNKPPLALTLTVQDLSVLVPLHSRCENYLRT